MSKHRGIVGLVAAAVLVGAAGVAVVWCLYRPLPDPAVADREDLLRWLVVRDLSAESSETLRVLARRLDEEFRGGFDWDATTEHLDTSQRTRVWDNVVLLLKPWFMDKQQRYFKLAAAERPAYLDQLLETIAVWRGVEALRPAPTETADPSTQQGGLLATLFAQVQQWKRDKDTEPKRRDQIQQFLLALQTRWLRQNMSKLFSSTP